MSRELKLFYIGNDYYDKSGTIMSPLYEEGSGERSDWGFVEVALEKGKTVTIRPANEKELQSADRVLASIRPRNG